MMFSDLVEHHIYRGVDRPISAKAYDYMLAGNGIFKRAHSRHIQACIPLAFAYVAGLPELDPEVDIRLSAGHIPGRLFYPILEDARRHARNGHEQMYQLRLVSSLGGLRWRVTLPPQRADGSRIAYQVGDGNGIICDLHSHHQMTAFFSATDDEDEGGFRFYAVIGRVLDRPEILLRLGMYGDFCYMPITTLFTDPGPFGDRFSSFDEETDYERQKDT